MDAHTPDHRRELARALEALEAELKAFIDRVADAATVVELDQGQQGRLSQMDAMSQQKMAEAQRRRATVRLTRVRNILETRDTEDFGCCGDCGEPIPMKRLRARPDSVLCVECAQARE